MDSFLPTDSKSKAGLDCGLGHACQFCPQEADCPLDKPFHNKTLIENRLGEIDQIILVLANKGGVGKSTVSTNLAAGLAQKGFRVGVADADIHGPNQSRFFGFAEAKTRTTYNGLKTHDFESETNEHPIKVGSLAFMLENDTTPIVWRDAYKHDFMHHLIGSFHWGSLDYLVIDMPPGTGNELITLCDMLEGSNVSAVLVTTPQAVAQMDSLKAGRFCKERGLPVVGAVVNMAGVVCPNCDHSFHLFPDANVDEGLAQFDIARLVDIPLVPELASGSDTGVPIVVSQSNGIVASVFVALAEKVAKAGGKDFSDAVAQTLAGVFEENLKDPQLNTALADLPEDVGIAVSALLDEETRRLSDAAAEKDH